MGLEAGRRAASFEVVRPLGLEPSVVRGKSPVPYQIGVRRVAAGDRP